MKRNLSLIVIASLFFAAFLFSCGAIAQTLTGTFPLLAGKKVRLEGFNGFDTYLISSSDISEDGKFRLNYSESDHGTGQLVSDDNRPFIVILSGEDIKLKGESFGHPETIEILKGIQNQLFEQYASEHPRREQALSAWAYLEKIYHLDTLFAIHETPRLAIKEEKHRIQQEDITFLASLDPDSYVSWFLPVRKLVSSVPTIAQYRTEEIPSAIHAFRNLDYTDTRLFKSGLLRETIESHFWLIENSGRSLDSVFIEMNISIDYMIENLSYDEEKLNLITNYLFKLLEQRSLYGSSEYLAIKLLNQNTCAIDDNFARQLESYRAMKIGNTAPDILFEGDVFRNGDLVTDPKRLSELENTYKLVIFGSAWCPMCTQELTQIQNLYAKWKSKGVEVIFVSLDTGKNDFKTLTSNFPFLSFCNYQEWETQAVQDYYVFATPTLFLLDADRNILLRPNSVRQMDAWVDWFLVQSNL